MSCWIYQKIKPLAPTQPETRPMRIKVYAPSFCSFKDIDENGHMILQDGAVLNDVYKKLRIPFILRKILFSTVNYKHSDLKERLKDGDVVSFFSGLAGG
jgi:molybdopterin converting factor small subunit